MTENHSIIIVGAGPGGIAVAAALHDRKISDVAIIESGEIGEAWSDYPSETHLLSESLPEKDDNKIDDVDTSDIFPNIPHPSHVLYQKYLAYVVAQKQITVIPHTSIDQVLFNSDLKEFCLTAHDGREFIAKKVIWSAGMFSTPVENMECEGCFIHYARFPYLNESSDEEMTVVGSANGATSVVMQLAKPGRVVKLLVPHTFEVPEPIDCLWKENMQFGLDLENEGLVEIIQNVRAKRIYKEDGMYVIETEDDKKILSKTKPILCIGFLPNIAPIKHLIDIKDEHHDLILQTDDAHQSLKQPGLYVAGVVGKKNHDQGMIVSFREFGPVIADNIVREL